MGMLLCNFFHIFFTAIVYCAGRSDDKLGKPEVRVNICADFNQFTQNT